MITIPVIQECPRSVTATGVLHVSHDILATFAGAVYDKDEWIAMLIGTRSDDGLTVTVNDIRIPLQERNTVNCSLVRQEPLTPEVVGVVHSHHSMRAFFSTTDDETLNTRFPVSIVIARQKETNAAEELLGFSYKAEGRVPLPCGSIGIIEFVVSPNPIVPAWPETSVIGFAEPHATSSLCYCPHVTQILNGFTALNTASCGVTRTGPAKAIFGRDGHAFMKEVEKQTRGSKHQRHQHGVSVVDNRQSFGYEIEQPSQFRYGYMSNYDALRGWGEVDY